MTFARAAFLLPAVACVISLLCLLPYVLRHLRQDPMVAGLDGLDDLRWNGWTLTLGWPPVTCWRGCADLHRDDWWRTHLCRTCWQGCADLHRDDWWRAYLEQADECREATPAPSPVLTSRVDADLLT